jgi:sortase (surface protein transpeptidase)
MAALTGLGLAVVAAVTTAPQAAAWSGSAAGGQRTVSWQKAHKHHAHSGPLGWRLSIPDIGVSAPVIRLGGPATGAISVPSFSEVWDVGWYRYGVVPGEQGNALLLGHVDTYMGPAVFYDLYELRPGDIVYVTLGHDGTRRFEVHWVKEVLKTHFPASRVLGGAEGRHLWIVTCGGQFDYVTRSYLSNIVVYTTLIQSHHHHHHHHH